MTERAFVRSVARVGLVDAQVHERHLFGVDDCSRYPLFSEEFLVAMRRLIPPEDQPRIATCITVTARKPPQDDGESELVASAGGGNAGDHERVFEGMSEQLPTFDAGDQHCGSGVARDIRRWWAGFEPGTRTLVIVRDPSAKADLPSLARMLGYHIEQEDEADGALRLIVRTKGN